MVVCYNSVRKVGKVDWFYFKGLFWNIEYIIIIKRDTNLFHLRSFHEWSSCQLPPPPFTIKNIFMSIMITIYGKKSVTDFWWHMVSVLVSRELWEGREVRLLYSIGNCLLHSKDFSTAVRVFEQLVEKDKHHKSSLLGGIGRIYLQVNNCY